jgi:hypothetical protein
MVVAERKWQFKTKFRARAYGWRGSRLAISRLKEAASEIKAAAKSDPVAAGDGAVSLMERIWPAFQDRLDENPELLFVLRGVDENKLLAIAGQDVALSIAAPAAAKTLDDSDVAALFGLEMAETANSATPIPATPKRPQRSRPLQASKAPSEAKTPAAKISKSPSATRTKSEPKWAALARARKTRAQRRLQRSA